MIICDSIRSLLSNSNNGGNGIVPDAVDADDLKARLNRETAKIPWTELQRFYAAGSVVVVAEALDLITVASQFSLDDKSQVEQWLGSGEVARVGDSQALSWLEQDALLWAVVVAPWVLVQEVSDR